MEHIAVSVIVPIYNAEPWLEECVQSILDQDFPASYGTIEVLLDSIRVDDDPAAVGRDELALPPLFETPQAEAQAPVNPLAAPRPGETFPTMTP